MVGWGSGPGMIEEPELEEGEAFDCKDDTRIDPDVALSYIGDKVQSILGHFQKDFEGGAFTENLGAKYGGYGSFLPTCQHSHSHRSQLKSHTRVQVPNLPGSPYHISTVSYGRNSSIPVQMGPAPCSTPSTRPSQTPKASSEDASIKQNAGTDFGLAETLLGKDELPSMKLDNPLKLRLKVRPDLMAQYNALGLASSPSSAESSPEESDGLPVESYDTHEESPDNIIQIMTSFPVAGSMLLSPLCEDLLNILKKKEHSVDNDTNDAAPKSSSICNRLLLTDDFRGKKQRSVGGGEKIDKSENKCAEKTSRRGAPQWMMSSHELDNKHLSNTVTDSEKDVQVRKKRLSKVRVKGTAESSDSVKAASLGHSFGKSYNKPEHRDLRFDSAEKVLENRGRISEDVILVDNGQGESSGNRNHASLKAHVDISGSKRVKGYPNIASEKVGLQPESGEEGQLGVPRAINKLLPEKKLKGSQFSGKLASKVAVNLRDSNCDALKNRDRGKKVHLGENYVGDTIAGCTENMKLASERPSGGRRKNSNLEAGKTKPTNADKLKHRSTKEPYLGSLTSLTYMPEPPAAAISSNGIITGLEQTIEEDWVACDNCEKWRLLPYGRSSTELSRKGNWTCSMLDWLPGMNRCDVSQDETTRAVQPTYPQNTISQYDLQAHVNNANYGVISAGFSQNYHNFTSDQVADQVKKQKLKGKQDTDSTSNAVPSNSKNNLQRCALQMGSTGELNQYSAAQYSKNKLDMQHVNKSITLVQQLNKQKDEHTIGDNINPRKKARKESFQHVDRMTKKIKVAGESNLNNFQKFGGNLSTSSHGLTSGLSNKAALGDGMKKTTQQVAISAGKSKIQIHLKKPQYQMQDLPDKGALGEKACNGREVSTIKRTSMEYEDSQHHTLVWKNNGSNLHHGKISMPEQKDGDSHKDKKSRVSQVEEKESKRCKGVESRVRSQESKEYLIDRALETEQQTRKLSEKGLTIEDLAKLKKDLGCEHLPTAATSTSSKVTDTVRIKIRYLDARSSPGESVSSSPARIPYPNQVSPLMMESEVKMNSRFNDALSRGSVKKSLNMNEGSETKITRNGKNTVAFCPVSSGNPVLDFRDTDARQNSCELASGVNYGNNEGSGKGHHRTVFSHKNPEKNLVRSCGEPVSSQTDQWNEGSRIELDQGDILGVPYPSKHISGVVGSLKRSSVDLRPSETSVKDSSKSLKDTAVACHQNGTDNFISHNESEKSSALDCRPANKNICNVTPSLALTKAKDVLREAEELRSRADLIKKSGFCSESNYGYFQAALKFLHGASMLEACNGETGKNMELNLTETYGTAARLCKTCACEYQKDHDVAAAALAYKCVEVACMRVVNIKSSTTQRIWHDLQSSLQMVPQGESPSSSASDVDNLNNSTMADKTTLSKGNVSHSGNHDIVLCNRPGFLQLLDYTGDTISAVEAAKKSQDMFAAACVKLEDSQSKEAVISLKRVIDSSFQDVVELIRLTWHAFSTINCQGPVGCRE